MTHLKDPELNRYSRQILLPEIDYTGQCQLKASHALIFGLGGLGSPASLYLAAAGIGKLTLIDFDTVDDSNLQRQIIHREKNIGQPKVKSAQQTLQQINSHIQITSLTQPPTDPQALQSLIQTADIVLDCTDNFKSRFALNQACFTTQTPLISGAAIRWEGQLSTYDFRQKQGPCYQCLYKPDSNNDTSCTQNGILAPVVGMIGSMQAIEAIKVLLNLPNLHGKLMIIDTLTMMIRTLNLKPDPQCPCCQQKNPTPDQPTC